MALSIVLLHADGIGLDELLSYGIGAAAAVAVAYVLSKLLDRFKGGSDDD